MSKKAIVTEIPTPSSSVFQSMIEDLKNNGTVVEKNLINGFETYIAEMNSSKQVLPLKGVSQQYKLWQLLKNLIENAPNDEFKKCWNIVLAYFFNYKETVFHHRLMFRFSEHWQWPLIDLNAFHRILNLINLTCEVDNRARGLKQVSLLKTLEEGFTDKGRERIINFYN